MKLFVTGTFFLLLSKLQKKHINYFQITPLDYSGSPKRCPPSALDSVVKQFLCAEPPWCWWWGDTDALWLQTWLIERLLESCSGGKAQSWAQPISEEPSCSSWLSAAQLFLLGELAKCVSLGAVGLGQELWLRTGDPGWWKEGRSGAGGWVSEQGDGSSLVIFHCLAQCQEPCCNLLPCL